eukprot:TRINITY_DN60134_c0_g1_i1.p1 TRINITY_DN60134_c0_g1~~TRINITY_DN60134_c0_g1_i1.p1  ORF type:complete len:585 (+),score=58.51 TRINITY_DN60134_c0_g1_i1:136-1890(+)
MSSAVVDLDIGGTLFRSTRRSLSKSPYLRALLNYKDTGALAVSCNSNGILFVDRSPALFPRVLDFLRDSCQRRQLELDSLEAANSLVEEFKFYGLDAQVTPPATGEQKGKRPPTQDALVCARWTNVRNEDVNDTPALYVHIEAPATLRKKLDRVCSPETIGLESDSDDDYSVRDGDTNVCLLWKELCPDAREIPARVSRALRVLKDDRFAEVSRSESSSMAQAHLDARIECSHSLFGQQRRRLKWKRVEPYEQVWHDVEHTESEKEDLDGCRLRENLHWVSETIVLRRDNTEAGPATRVVTVTVTCEENPAVCLPAALREVSVQTDFPGAPTSEPTLADNASVFEPHALAGHPVGTTSSPISSCQEAVTAWAVPAAENEKPSESQAAEQMNGDIAEALMRSRQDCYDCVLLRLTSHSPEFMNALCADELLASCIERVEEAGCQMSPAWANGALFLVPMTQSQLEDMRLQPYHIVARACDMSRIEKVLQAFPKRQRPRVKLVEEEEMERHRASRAAASSSAADRAQEDARERAPESSELGLVLERTFLSRPEPHALRDSGSVVQSAPCVGDVDSEPLNPRRIIVD